MKKLFWAFSLISASVCAQAPKTNAYATYYFDDVKKAKRILFIEDNVYNNPTIPGQHPGCVELKRPQTPFNDVSQRAEEIITLINQKFSQTLTQNPKIKEYFEREVREVAKSKSCFEINNICRGKLFATAMFHFENLRPDMPGCAGYVKQDSKENPKYVRDCELELEFRDKKFTKYEPRVNDPGSDYIDRMVTSLDAITTEVRKLALYKSLGFPNGTRRNPGLEVFAMEMPEICSKAPFIFKLKTMPFYEPIYGIDPSQRSVEQLERKVESCVEDIGILYSEFVPLNFDEGRSEVGGAQTDPVKDKIKAFILANPNLVITDVSVTSNSSRTPFYKTGPKGKKIIDPDSDKRNTNLASERSRFAARALDDLKNSSSELGAVNFETKFTLAGPAFNPSDMNNRSITKQSPGYEKKITEIYNANKELLQSEALVMSASELMDQKKFSNLYQAKYKPFQGFKIIISGHKKDMSKCGDKSGGISTKGSSSFKTSNQ